MCVLIVLPVWCSIIKIEKKEFAKKKKLISALGKRSDKVQSYLTSQAFKVNCKGYKIEKFLLNLGT